MLPLTDNVKYDLALTPQTINNSNATGRYFPVAGFRRFAAIASCGAIAAGKKLKVELLQAKDMAGTDAKPVAGTPSAESVAGVKDVKDTLTLASVSVSDIVKINGLTFTAHATVTDVTKRQFSIGGNDTADAAALVTCINDPQYGVPGVFASSAAAVVTLVPGKVNPVPITVTEPAATITLAVLEASVFVECDIHDVDAAGGFTYVAAKVTTDGNTPLFCVLLRGSARYSQVQNVGAGKVV